MEVLQLGDELLRGKAQPVDGVTDGIRALVAEMFETMEQQQGVGLAGPQVGVPLRLFVVKAGDSVRRAFINPTVIEASEETGEYEEGCLSIPGVYHNVVRPRWINVQALAPDGTPFTLRADGLLARVIQHENDHLEGILFVDRVGDEFRDRISALFALRRERRAEKKAQKAAKSARLQAKIAAKQRKAASC